MLILKRSTWVFLFSGLLLGCSKSDDDSAGAGSETGLAAADIAGQWDMTAVPFSGDTTPTRFTLNATGNDEGWTISFPGRAPIETRIRFDADSVVTEVGPYESVRRKGVQVRTQSVMRLQGDTLVGTSIARYTTQGKDSVLRLRTSGVRVR